MLRDSDILYKYMSHNWLLRFVSRSHIACLARIIDGLPDQGRLKVADIGCGDSFAGAALQLSCRNVGSIVGLDVDANKLRISREVYQQNELDCSLVQGSIYDLPFDNETFDLVLCSEVLEHLDDAPRALRELHRITKRYCLLSVPNDVVFRLANLARGRYLRALGNPPEHIHHFGPRTFRKLISRTFTIQEARLPVGLWTVALATKQNWQARAL